MPLLARTVHTPLAIDVVPGAVRHLGRFLADRRIAGSADIAVIVGPGLGAEISDLIRDQLERAEIFTIAGGTLDAAIELGEKLRAGSFEAVVGIGGGKVIDTVKHAASQQGLPMVAVATSLAHDGVASPVSSLERNGNSVSYGVHAPIAVLVDLDFVKRSPIRQTRSGIGDALSNLCAVDDWRLAHEVHGEPIDGLALALASTSASALLNHPGAIGDSDLLTSLANALVLGGVAMAMAGSSRPCSGGCHEIAHAIDQIYPGTGTHGELVGVGALFCTYLRGNESLLRRMSDAFHRHGLPRTPAAIGLSPEQFTEAVMRAPSTRPGRYTILEHLALPPEATLAKVVDFGFTVGAHPQPDR